MAGPVIQHVQPDMEPAGLRRRSVTVVLDGQFRLAAGSARAHVQSGDVQHGELRHGGLPDAVSLQLLANDSHVTLERRCCAGPLPHIHKNKTPACVFILVLFSEAIYLTPSVAERKCTDVDGFQSQFKEISFLFIVENGVLCHRCPATTAGSALCKEENGVC